MCNDRTTGVKVGVKVGLFLPWNEERQPAQQTHLYTLYIHYSPEVVSYLILEGKSPLSTDFPKFYPILSALSFLKPA